MPFAAAVIRNINSDDVFTRRAAVSVDETGDGQSPAADVLRNGSSIYRITV